MTIESTTQDLINPEKLEAILAHIEEFEQELTEKGGDKASSLLKKLAICRIVILAKMSPQWDPSQFNPVKSVEDFCAIVLQEVARYLNGPRKYRLKTVKRTYTREKLQSLLKFVDDYLHVLKKHGKAEEEQETCRTLEWEIGFIMDCLENDWEAYKLANYGERHALISHLKDIEAGLKMFNEMPLN